ncbi:MAG: hypothetical protein AAGA85_13010 [Bacteroidota bacterium]
MNLISLATNRSIVVCLLVVIGCDSQNTTERLYFENGNLKEVGEFLEGKRVGFWVKFDIEGDTLEKNYYSDGVVATSSIYVNNKFSILDSIKANTKVRRRYFENGALHTRMVLVDDVQNGPFVSYYEDGQMHVEGNFENGRPRGFYKQYYPSGIVQYFSESMGNGILLAYDSSGNLEYEILYENLAIKDTLKFYR